MVKINYGSGTCGIKTWLNYDNALRHIILARVPLLPSVLHKFSNILSPEVYDAYKNGVLRYTRYANAATRIHHKDNTVDYIYTSHMLEHLFYEDGQRFVAECFRVLRKDGVLRIAIPDLEAEARLYVRLLEQGHCNESAAERLVQVFFEKNERDFNKYGHRWMYDFASLSFSLKKAGFRAIARCSFRVGMTPDLEQIEHRKESLFVEAQK